MTGLKTFGAKLWTKTSLDMWTYSSKEMTPSSLRSPTAIRPSTRFSSCFWVKFSWKKSERLRDFFFL